MQELNNRVCLITGAARGIGRAIAERFGAAGATLILTVRNDAAERELRDAFPGATIAHCDIAVDADVHRLRDVVQQAHGHVDMLINNAGVFVDADHELTADRLDRATLQTTLDTNLFGTIAMCVAFAPLVPDGGRIINVSSTMGQLDDGLEPYATAYSVSKTALNAYTSSLAAALRVRHILTDAMHPGWVQTEMGGPNARITPEESTETAWFLATRAPGDTGKFWDRSAVTAW